MATAGRTQKRSGEASRISGWRTTNAANTCPCMMIVLCQCTGLLPNAYCSGRTSAGVNTFSAAKSNSARELSDQSQQSLRVRCQRQSPSRAKPNESEALGDGPKRNLQGLQRPRYRTAGHPPVAPIERHALPSYQSAKPTPLQPPLNATHAHPLSAPQRSATDSDTPSKVLPAPIASAR